MTKYVYEGNKDKFDGTTTIKVRDFGDVNKGESFEASDEVIERLRKRFIIVPEGEHVEEDVVDEIETDEVEDLEPEDQDEDADQETEASSWYDDESERAEGAQFD